MKKDIAILRVRGPTKVKPLDYAKQASPGIQLEPKSICSYLLNISATNN
jgi:hypothetical protein